MRWIGPLLALPVAAALLLVTIRVSTPTAAVLALAVAFFMVEITEGAYGAAIMRVATADVAAAMGVLNTGGNVGRIFTQPIVGYLTDKGLWGGAFVTGSVFAMAAAGIWLVINAERRAAVD